MRGQAIAALAITVVMSVLTSVVGGDPEPWLAAMVVVLGLAPRKERDQ